MKKLALIFVLCAVVWASAQTVSYWFEGFQRQPSRAAAIKYLFRATNAPAAGNALRWDGTNYYWAP